MGLGIQIGLNSLYYAVMTSDDPVAGATYLTPVNMAGGIEAKVTPKMDMATLFADDGPAEVATTLGEVEVELNIKTISLDDLATLLGHTVTGGVLTKKSSDIPPYVAIGFKSVKSNGKYRYVWLYKGKFALNEHDFKTKGDKIDFQTSTIKGTFIRRDADLGWQKVADEEHPNYVSTTGTNWFTAVDTLDSTPPTATIVPANNATSIAASTTIVWTFNEPILASTVNLANFIVQKSDASAQVAGTIALDTTKKIVTFTPSTNLASATQYMAIATTGVKDLSGNALASTMATRFTTA